jgi:uncharacterized coiled-coil protein SlyX
MTNNNNNNNNNTAAPGLDPSNITSPIPKGLRDDTYATHRAFFENRLTRLQRQITNQEIGFAKLEQTLSEKKQRYLQLKAKRRSEKDCVELLNAHAKLCKARKEINTKTDKYNELVKRFEEVNEGHCERLRGELGREVRQLVEDGSSRVMGKGYKTVKRRGGSA